MASDDSALFGGLSQASMRSEDGEGKNRGAKRKALRRADYASTQLYQPHTPSPIERATLEGLWDVVKKGNEYTEYHTYLADPDPLRQGVAISQFAQSMKHAILHFREERVACVLKADVYKKVKEVADEIYPHVVFLDGGYHCTTGGIASLRRTIDVKSERDVEKSAEVIYDWLKRKQCPLRAYLQIMSGSGIVYAGQCEEKVARAYLLVGNTSLTSFQDAARKRLCCSHASQGVQDDLALTQR